MMNLHPRKLLTIVTEASIEKQVVTDIRHSGAHGWTITDARGAGASGHQGATFGMDANIRIEVVCDEPTASNLVECLKQKYYDNYAMILYLSDVAVLRPDKF